MNRRSVTTRGAIRPKLRAFRIGVGPAGDDPCDATEFPADRRAPGVDTTVREPAAANAWMAALHVSAGRRWLTHDPLPVAELSRTLEFIAECLIEAGGATSEVREALTVPKFEASGAREYARVLERTSALLCSLRENGRKAR
jgi:hypothetical protein